MQCYPYSSLFSKAGSTKFSNPKNLINTFNHHKIPATFQSTFFPPGFTLTLNFVHFYQEFIPFEFQCTQNFWIPTELQDVNIYHCLVWDGFRPVAFSRKLECEMMQRRQMCWWCKAPRYKLINYTTWNTTVQGNQVWRLHTLNAASLASLTTTLQQTLWKCCTISSSQNTTSI